MNKCCCFRNRLQTCDFEGKGRYKKKATEVIFHRRLVFESFLRSFGLL